MAPAGTPRDVVARLHAEITKAVQGAELRSRFVPQGIELTPSASPEEFTAFVKSEVARYARLARDANIKGQ
jgi:tripartite-type tricarboxylate transporter receptor subunit TctC